MKIYLIFIYLLIIVNCKYFGSRKEETRKIIDYYHGIVLNEQYETLSGVKVKILDSNEQIASTNDKGYFQIKNKGFNKINIQKEKKIIFDKDGYIADTLSTFLLGPNYGTNNRRLNNYFIYEIPDTVILKKRIF